MFSTQRTLKLSQFMFLMGLVQLVELRLLKKAVGTKMPTARQVFNQLSKK